MGRVRVAVPLAVDDEALRLSVVGKLSWIKRQEAKFQAQPRQSERHMVSGESHYFLGCRYRLRAQETTGPMRVALRGTATLDMFVSAGMSNERRERLLHDFYRVKLKRRVPQLLES